VKIPAVRVVIRRQYLVDCNVCGAGVEPDEEFWDRVSAEEAKQRHLDEHANGEW
jgi:hypothetical protein